MNELYEKTIEIEGRTYRYDPDFDCYYRSEPQQTLSLRDGKFMKLVLSYILLITVLTR